MNIYSNFSRVYDMFIDVDYQKIIAFIREVWRRSNLEPKLTVDLGCGTGEVALRLAQIGYDVIAIDSSPDMLTCAREKAEGLEIPPLFLCQKMEQFELYGSVNAILCLTDCLNYLLHIQSVEKVFKLCQNYLEPGGILIFDINTEYKYSKVLGSTVFADAGEDAAYICENYYDEKNKINSYVLTGFVKEKRELYSRFEETHIQKAYPVETIRESLEKSGLKVMDIYDGYTFKPINNCSLKAVFTARKN